MAADRLLVFFDGEADDALLELVAKHHIAGGGVELGQKFLLALLSLLSQLSRVVISRGGKHLILGPWRSVFLFLRSIPIEYSSVFSTDLFADKVKLSIEVGYGILGRWQLIARGNLILILLFLKQQCLVLMLSTRIQRLRELDGNHNVGLLLLEYVIEGVGFSAFDRGLGHGLDGETLSH